MELNSDSIIGGTPGWQYPDGSTVCVIDLKRSWLIVGLHWFLNDSYPHLLLKMKRLWRQGASKCFSEVVSFRDLCQARCYLTVVFASHLSQRVFWSYLVIGAQNVDSNQALWIGVPLNFVSANARSLAHVHYVFFPAFFSAAFFFLDFLS